MRGLSSILITGGGSGIGRALALASARRGLDVVVADRDPAAAAAVAESLAGGAVRGLDVAMDVTSPASIARARESVLAAYGPVDILVNNAGIVHGGSFTELPLEQHLDTFRVNLLGVVAVTHRWLPDLVARPASHVVNVASASGFVALPFGSTYASSKWGVVGFSESLRREMEVLGHLHVGVTTVCPGYAATGMFAGARPPRTTRFLAPEELAERILDAVARNRPFLFAPWLTRLGPALRGIVPTRALDRISDLFGATRSMERWRGRGDEGRN